MSDTNNSTSSDNSTPEPTPSPLPPIRRLVTSPHSTLTHDALLPPTALKIGPSLIPLWQTPTQPPTVSTPGDAALTPVGLTNDGTIVRILDVPPKAVLPLHRTISLDYVYVIKGEVVLTLGDGSRTKLGEGGVVVQQAACHGWENEGEGWVRLLLVMTRAEAPVLEGKVVEEDVPFVVE